MIDNYIFEAINSIQLFKRVQEREVVKLMNC